MKSQWVWLVLLFFGALWIAGCTVQLPVPEQMAPTATAEAGCPTPSPEQELARNDAAGYCFTIPVDYEAEVFQGTIGSVVRAPVTSAGHRERLLIYVEPALGRSLGQVTEQTLANYTIPGMQGEVSFNVMGGEPATVITGLPGQDPNRWVLTVHDGRAYALMFVPDQPKMGEAYQEMATLFDAVMESFTFTTPTVPMMALPMSAGQQSGYPADAALSWERRAYGDGGVVAECYRLSVAGDGTTWAGTCGQADVEVPNAPYQWDEIRSSFAPFVFRGGDWDLLFVGQGDVYHPIWVQALGAWAQATYGEAVNGRASATGRTAFSWWLGPAEGEVGLCRHLVILSHGYASASLEPCEGGAPQTTAAGWLETTEMVTFAGWAFGAAPVYLENSYLDGRGEQKLSQADIEQLEQWALQVYRRLQSQSTP